MGNHVIRADGRLDKYTGYTYPSYGFAVKLSTVPSANPEFEPLPCLIASPSPEVQRCLYPNVSHQ